MAKYKVGDIVLFLTPEHSGIATIKNIAEEGIEGLDSIYEIKDVTLTQWEGETGLIDSEILMVLNS